MIMHELSIATNIVAIAEEQAEQNKAKSVKEITIEIGALSGVVIEALEFAMEEAIKKTLLEKSHYNILLIPAKGRCRQCKKEFDMEEHFAVCPFCQHTQIDIIQGKELNVKSLKIET
jgi:hydrogenase nickel incorporation protein HypA/HybF